MIAMTRKDAYELQSLQPSLLCGAHHLFAL
jgi:hypothetical protein